MHANFHANPSDEWQFYNNASLDAWSKRLNPTFLYNNILQQTLSNTIPDFVLSGDWYSEKGPSKALYQQILYEYIWL